ncbi:hypothetical protein [Ramlibacter sp.]|uniref:hypothetical protein n=1 Tax=Ramlibacter sp. TaxID=1917967 RepID=UPI00261BCE85|nr:hypothetical protein [Ramlibacter sp.]MDB5955286.1 hypothetical protein [Ramlibacter sp.]
METLGHSNLTPDTLATEKARYFGTAGCSAGNRGCGFRPAFQDRETGRVFLSAFADGRPAPVHVLDGLPPSLVLARTALGRVCAVKGSVISGFARDGHFYTRDEALREAEAEADPFPLVA